MKSNDLKKILNELENDLNLINPELREWNQIYFRNQKNRYIPDLETIKKWYNGGKILEMGSVPCHFTYILKKMGLAVTGLDIDPNRSKQFIEKHKLDVIKCDIEKDKIPFKNNSFDLVIFNEILEHLRIDPIFALKEVNRVLKPNKNMILTTPNLYSIINISSFLMGKSINDAYDEFDKIHTLGHAGHVREFSSNEVKRFLKNTGFEVIEAKFINYDYEEYGYLGSSLSRFLKIFSRINPRWRDMQVIISKKL